MEGVVVVKVVVVVVGGGGSDRMEVIYQGIGRQRVDRVRHVKQSVTSAFL
jgi:hypothetical protein